MSMRSNKLRVVIRHEFLTIVKQPSFWISLIAIPVLLAFIMGVSYLTNSDSDTDVDVSSQELRIKIVDNSGLIVPEAADQFGVSIEDGDIESLTEDVKSRDLDGLIVYPEDLLSSGTYRVVADNTDDNNAATTEQIAKLILQQSVLAPIESGELKSLAIAGGQAEIESYEDGERSRDFAEFIVPGSFLVIFYIVLVFSVGYALSSVSEEKENRSIEMVLSYVKPQILILGKLTAVILVTLTQVAFFILLGVLGYFIARSLGNDLSLPFSLSSLVFDPSSILFGLAFLVFGFIFFVSLMATIGAIFPSTKEASSFSTVFYLMPAIPFWGFSAITTQPDSLFTQILTYFPLSSPTAALLRNTVGNLSVAEGIISLTILILTTVATILLAGKAFRLGTLEYSSRVKMTDLLK